MITGPVLTAPHLSEMTRIVMLCLLLGENEVKNKKKNLKFIQHPSFNIEIPCRIRNRLREWSGSLKKKKYSYSKLHCIERKKKKSGFPAITVTFWYSFSIIKPIYSVHVLNTILFYFFRFVVCFFIPSIGRDYYCCWNSIWESVVAGHSTRIVIVD